MLVSVPLLLPLGLCWLATTLALCTLRTPPETNTAGAEAGGQGLKGKWNTLKAKSKEKLDNVGGAVKGKARSDTNLSRYKTTKEGGGGGAGPSKTSTLTSTPATSVPVKLLIASKESAAADLDDDMLGVLMKAQVKSISIYLHTPSSMNSK